MKVRKLCTGHRGFQVSNRTADELALTQHAVVQLAVFKGAVDEGAVGEVAVVKGFLCKFKARKALSLAVFGAHQITSPPLTPST